MQWIPNQRLIAVHRVSIFIPLTNVKGLAMKSQTCSDTWNSANAFSLNLRHQALFSVPDAANIRIACVEGTVWITLDNDPRDIVLDARGVFTTQEHRRALVYAMEPSTITVTPSTLAAAPQRGRAQGIDHGLAAMKRAFASTASAG
jgi:Protein of unknown function (DUF2917)